jgi:hypothetical protein
MPISCDSRAYSSGHGFKPHGFSTVAIPRSFNPMSTEAEAPDMEMSNMLTNILACLRIIADCIVVFILAMK